VVVIYSSLCGWKKAICHALLDSGIRFLDSSKFACIILKSNHIKLRRETWIKTVMHHSKIHVNLKVLCHYPVMQLLVGHVFDVCDSSFSDLKAFLLFNNHFPLPIIEVAPLFLEGGREEAVWVPSLFINVACPCIYCTPVFESMILCRIWLIFMTFLCYSVINIFFFKKNPCNATLFHLRYYKMHNNHFTKFGTLKPSG